MEYYFSKNIEKDKVAVLHFGLGLLGSSIKESFMGGSLFSQVKSIHVPTNWNDVEETIVDLNKSFRENKALILESNIVYVIWSAGKSGFSASEIESNKQLVLFKKLVRALSEIFSKELVNSKFILLGSAGGLFESQIGVTKNSKPKPLRPYGKMKLEEENFLLENDLFKSVEIARISSVYSIKNGNNRKGLVQVLVENGILNKESQIFGDESTLRDYVLDDDIAKYIVSSIYEGNDNPKISFLIDGKPSSIFEIKKSIQQILNKKLYIVNSTKKENAMNMSFVPSLSAKGFKSSNYIANIAKFRINFNK